MRFLPSLIAQGDRVIDIGGNRGVYAYQLWRLGARVEVFEPNPTCFAVLESWAMGKSSVHLHSVALSSCSGSASLHIPVDEAGVEHDASASIENARFAQTRDQLVSLQTLDSYHFEGLSLIKIDVEGHEYSVIEGAATTITSSKPALLIEIEQRHIDRPIADVFQKILSFGYQGFFLGESGMTPLEQFDVARHQSMENFGISKELYINNFLFLHETRIENGGYGALINQELSK